MNTSKILELVKIVEEHDIEEIEITRLGQKIRISKSGGNASHFPVQFGASVGPKAVAAPETKIPEPPAVETFSGTEVKSPMVGTFYRAPAPDAEPFVKIGDQISIGQTLCIVEAMKVMNEIEAEIAGTLVKILVENGEPVEYDQPLFIIE
ncbi:MAG: acetyl-CoA carboxylase biotin carboxyl carrier protein [Candidatus Marinimicrobia bacterium]|nr:acetyl-CoA carboxylase biotin carboxyl carrier protein [Candidatus Neomarinimicrobiota bacterium]